MITVKSIVNTVVNLSVLKAAAQATFGTAFLDCNITDNGLSVTLYLSAPVANQQQLWDNLVGAQDPVYLQQDKVLCTADGVDAVTVSVQAPKLGAVVTLQVQTPNGGVLTQPVTLTGGIGSVQIRTLLYGPHVVTVQNPANRSADTLLFQGV